MFGDLYLDAGLTTEALKTAYILEFSISSIILIVGFLFKAFAIRAMAKNQGLNKLYFAFIPFLNYVLLGKVIGVSYIFRKKVNNVGVLVAIFGLISFIVRTLLNLGYYVRVLGEIFNFSIFYNSAFITNWMEQTGTFYTIIYYAYDVLSIFEIIVTVALVFFVFRKYCPERAFFYGLVSIFVDFMFGVLLFVVRNRKPSGYSEFMRTRVRTGYNTYDNAYKHYEKKNGVDPFPEFSNKEPTNNDSDNNQNINGSNGADDFFN